MSRQSYKDKSLKKPVFWRSRARAALTADERQIIDAALEAKEEWLEAGINFEQVTDELLVDYYVYRMKALRIEIHLFSGLPRQKAFPAFFKTQVIFGRLHKINNNTAACFHAAQVPASCRVWGCCRDIGVILAYAAGIILMLVLVRLFLKPLKVVMRLILNAVLGALALLIVNWIGKPAGFI